MSGNDGQKHAEERERVEHPNNKKRNKKRKNVIGEETATPDDVKHKSKKKRSKEGESTAGADTTGQEAEGYRKEGDTYAISNQSSAANPRITKSGNDGEKHAGEEKKEDVEQRTHAVKEPRIKKNALDGLPPSVEDWTVDHVYKWLKRLGKQKYNAKNAFSRATFKQQAINGESLLMMTDERLKGTYLPEEGKRAVLLAAIKSLQGDTEAVKRLREREVTLADLSRARGIDFSIDSHDSATGFDMDSLKNRIKITMERTGMSTDCPVEPNLTGVRRLPLPYLEGVGLVPQFLSHIGEETRKTLSVIVRGSQQTAQQGKYISIFSQSSGCGKTHALYCLGRDPEQNALVILCNVAVNQDNPDGQGCLTKPWSFLKRKLSDLDSKLERNSSEDWVLAISDAAYATLQLVVCGYLEFIAEFLEEFNGEGISKIDLRIAALWALRNGVGETAVMQFIEQRLNTGDNGVLREKRVSQESFTVPDRDKVDIRITSAVKRLKEMIPNVTIILAVDEVQALDQVGKGVFLHNSQYAKLGKDSPYPKLSENPEEENAHSSDEKTVELSTDAIYALNIISTRLNVHGNVGSVFVGTKCSFAQLKKVSVVSPTRFMMRYVHDVDIFTSDDVKRLLLEYFNVEEAWDRLWDQCPEFRENIELLQGRALWAATLVGFFDTALPYKMDREVNVENKLKEAAEDAVGYQKESIGNLVKKAFESPRPVGSGDLTTETAMLTLYAAIQLDAEDSKLSEKMIDTLIVNSTVSVHKERALLQKEPMVRTCVYEKVESLLVEGSAKLDNYYLKQLKDIVQNMVSGSLLQTHSSLGEFAEPLLCHMFLLARFKFDWPPTLWDVLSPFLGYLTKHAENEGSELGTKAHAIIEDLRGKTCGIRVCKNLSRVKEEHASGTELKCLFKTFPPDPEEADTHSGYVCFLLDQCAGADICFLTKPTHVHSGSVIIQSKVILRGDFEVAARTTDPNLQYLNDQQRRYAVAGENVTKPTNARRAYDEMRRELGEHDPFKHCNRFVAALEFTETTKEDAIRKYEFTSCPLLPLDLKEGLALVYGMKQELSGDKRVQPLRDMDETNRLWGSVEVQYGSPVADSSSCQNSSSAATRRGTSSAAARRGASSGATRRGASSAATPRRRASLKKPSK